ncbi:MAG: SDR family NAD(P)-dependent oxidoreductase [Chloroflexota bacterium]
MQLSGKTIFLTGAASGLGRELALQLDQAGCYMLLADRNAAQLADVCAQLANPAQPFVCDLSQADERKTLMADLDELATRKNIHISALVHCAGIGSHAALEVMTTEEVNQVLQVNTVAPLELTAGLKSLLKPGEPGGIVFIGSVAGEMTTPSMGLYSASKAALHAFARATSLELAVNGHFTLLVILGALKNTRFAASIRNPATHQPGWYRRLDADPRLVAAKIIQAMRKERNTLVYPAWYNLVFFLSRSFAPLTRFVSQHAYRRYRQ